MSSATLAPPGLASTEHAQSMSVPRLVIRAAQMEAMSQAYRRSFVRRLVRHLTVDFPKQREGYGILEMDVEPLVEKGMAEAESYGLTSQDDVQLYLECMVVYGPGFDCDGRHPWAAGILQRDDLDSDTKADELTGHLVLEWQEPR